MHFLHPVKSKVQTLFSSVHILRSKYNIIQVNKKFEYVYMNLKPIINICYYMLAELLKTLISI